MKTKHISIWLLLAVAGCAAAPDEVPYNNLFGFAKPVTTDFRERGPKGWLGITMKEEGESIRVVQVFPNSPAEKAGLLPEDKILAMNDQPIGPGEANSRALHFRRVVGQKSAGEILILKIDRRDTQIEISVTLEPKPAAIVILKPHPELAGQAGGTENSLLQKILQKENLEGEFEKTLEEMRDRSGHAVSTAVKGSDYNPFRLQEINYVMNRPMDLPLVADRMTSDLEMSFGKKKNLFALAGLGMKGLDISVAHEAEQNEKTPADLVEFIDRFVEAVVEAKKVRHDVLAVLSAEEIATLNETIEEFVTQDPLEGLKQPTDEEKKRDEEKLLRFINSALKVDLDRLMNAGMKVVRVLDVNTLLALRKKFPAGYSPREDWAVSQQPNLTVIQTPAGKILIGGEGDNIYEEDVLLIIDLGGEDKYLNRAGGSTPANPFTAVIDYSGNDTYSSEKVFSQGTGRLGAGFLIDLEGDDVYRAKNIAQGMGFFGIGMLVDLQGDDKYECRALCQASGLFGIGLLAEGRGHDDYKAAIYAQGFGYVKGYGALVEAEGSDHYFAGGVYPDHRDPENSYQSLAQGFGLGIRPWDIIAGTSGGIGVLIDSAGDDVYVADYFAQGASYWYSLGVLADKKGNDKYISSRYSQGAGVHLSAGILTDTEGDDEYRASFGVAQGCGHDLAVGFLIDHQGDDLYESGTIAQGAGNANGIGILNDNGGGDIYKIREKGQARGEYIKFRQLGSFGILFDTGGGADHYSSGLTNGQLKIKTRWGLFADTQ